MSDFTNYTKPAQITTIEALLFDIGFLRQSPTYWSGIFHYKYSNWVIMIEHKKNDSVSETIRFEIFRMGFLDNRNIAFRQTNYQEFNEHLFHGYQNEQYKAYEEDFNKFMITCLNHLKIDFKHEIRKSKIKKMLQ